MKVYMKDKVVSEVKSVCFLGVVIDSNLTWEAHIDKTSNKIRSSLLIINRLSKITKLDVMWTIYYGLVYPFL
jgi:hypothetical protein